MKFEKIIPAQKLRPYIKYFIISENTNEHIYKVYPSTALVIGFQYKGQLSVMKDNTEAVLSLSGITGLQDNFKIFKNTSAIGSILVYFTETGITYFSEVPAHELLNQSVSLDNLFDKNEVAETEDKLCNARTDKERITIVERFLSSQIKEREEDRLIVEAVKRIYQLKGIIKINELSKQLFISQSPFEKRFRKIVGTSPKKFASIVRFNALLSHLNTSKSLTKLCYEYNFFDQAHFINDFKKYTGDTPESFKRFQ